MEKKDTHFNWFFVVIHFRTNSYNLGNLKEKTFCSRIEFMKNKIKIKIQFYCVCVNDTEYILKSVYI